MRYSLILASITGAITVVSAFPQQYDNFLSEREALAYPEFQDGPSFLEARDARLRPKVYGGRKAYGGGRYGDSVRQQTNQVGKIVPPTGQDLGNSFTQQQGQASQQTQVPSQNAQESTGAALRRRDFQFNTGSTGKIGGDQVTRRDPKFWNTVKHDAGVVGHDVGQAAKVAAPIAMEYAPEMAGALLVRDVLLKRHPNFWNTVKNDTEAALPTVAEFAPEAGEIAWDAAKKFKKPVRRWAQPEAEAKIPHFKVPHFSWKPHLPAKGSGSSPVDPFSQHPSQQIPSQQYPGQQYPSQQFQSQQNPPNQGRSGFIPGDKQAQVQFNTGSSGEIGGSQQRRDPNFWKSVKHDAGVAGHDAGQVAKAAAPVAMQYAPEMAEALLARDILKRNPSLWGDVKHDAGVAAKDAGQAAQAALPYVAQYGPDIAQAAFDAHSAHKQAKEAARRDLLKRNPSFWKDVKHDAGVAVNDAGQAAQAALPYVAQYGPDIAQAAFDAHSSHKQAKEAARRWADPEADFYDLSERDLEEIYARDPNFLQDIGKDFTKIAGGVVKGVANVAEAGIDIASHIKRDAEPDYEDLFERDLYERDAEADYDDLFERDLEELYERDFEDLYARDPNFFQDLENDVGQVANAVAPVVEKVAPMAIKAVTHIKRDPDADFDDLSERDLEELWEREFEEHYARDPNFLQDIGKDFTKIAGGVVKGVAGVAEAGMDIVSHIKRDADAEAVYDGLYERDAEAEADPYDVFERDAEPEADPYDVFERDAEAEAEYGEFVERDAEVDGFLNALKARGLGYLIDSKFW